jgi:hypothetical protein
MPLILDGTEGITQPSITGAFGVPSGTTAQRPNPAEVGMIRFNTDTEQLENFTTNNGWVVVAADFPILAQVTGTIFNGGASVLTLTGQKFLSSPGQVRFTSGATVVDAPVISSNDTSATVEVPSAIQALSVGTVVAIQYVTSANTVSNPVNKTVEFAILVQALIVAGGGAGVRGGGGAGGLLYYGTETPKTPNGSALPINAATNYTLTVGAGGAGGAKNNGSNSVALGRTAIGGGAGGGSGAEPGNAGGSGGGQGGTGGSGQTNTGFGTAGQGNNGGDCSPGTGDRDGGGGGAGAAGGNATATNSGNGGIGLQYSISGSATYYAGGGAGRTSVAGTGGLGGGGTMTAGTANTGGGGSDNKSGGSGIVILRYSDTLTITNPGGGLTFSTTSSGGFKVTTFTAGTGNIQFN